MAQLTPLFLVPRNLPTTISITKPDERKRLLEELQPSLRYSAKIKSAHLLETATPLAKLPKAVDPFSGFTRHRVPVLRFGVPISVDQLNKLMLAAGWPPENIPKGYEHNSDGEDVATTWLSKQLGWNVSLRNGWGCEPHGMLIEMYNNYTPKEKYAPDTVVQALKKILDSEADAQWYIDLAKADWDWHIHRQ
ncbi:hypothetical protein M422DRAFT_68570 [Sphaerobolus stellatus SS14]|uniref:Uncharacterized protein n=1 Tax=Sphaerobolus stellatus (strain SS14) TaxID=990650 RepID=A0A0C9VQT3_SPHS4|nr:hypothetical protein M422DRAFT_68570 [Sphaerobolus stellatus SS14]